MKDILKTIVEEKKEVLAKSQSQVSLQDLKSMPLFNRQCIPFRASMEAKGFGIIAEIKRKSPSAGDIRPNLDIASLAQAYEAGGASAISCLTNFHFFGGQLTDLELLRSKTKLPLLRKDFLFDPYQIYEAKAFGADAILLICEILSKNEIKNLTDLAHDLGMEVLLEVHHPEETSKLIDTVDLIGINNRNLKLQVTDLKQSEELFDQIPKGPLPITESGIKTVDDILRLRNHGYQGALIGESILSQNDPAFFISQLQNG